jgi:hypothetical protein
VPNYLVVHKHEYGGSGYEVETDFDLMEATRAHPDWAERLASIMGVNYEPWKDEELDVSPFEEITYVKVSEKDFLGADISEEEVPEKD